MKKLKKLKLSEIDLNPANKLSPVQQGVCL